MPRTITVKGVGKLSLKPDYTVVSLSLKTVSKVYDTAMSQGRGGAGRAVWRVSRHRLSEG